MHSSDEQPAGGFRVEGIFHPVLSVPDMGTAVHFYRDLLGLKVTFDDYHDPQAIGRLFGMAEPQVRSVVLEFPDRSEFELVEFQQPRGQPSTEQGMNDAGIVALALRVVGLRRIVERLRDGGWLGGAEIVEQLLPDGAVLQVLVCRGPGGARIILVQPPAGRRSLGA